MLAVWLPLNGDINNQGVSSLTKTAGTPQYKAGKIGQGLDLNSRVTFSCPDLAGTTKFTVAFWVMLENNTNLSTNWQDIISFTDQKSDNSAIGYLRAETCYLSSYNPNYYGVHWHDNATYAMSSSTSTLPTHYKGDRGVWHHCVMTFDSEGMATGYTDGVLIGSYSNNNAGGHLTGAFWLGETNNIAGCINDVRIYKDQILSEQEIKKLSQGLVLHLPLSRKGFGLDNIIKNSQLFTNKDDWIHGGTPLVSEFTTKEGFECWHITGQLQKYITLTPYFTVNSTKYLGVQSNGNTYTLSMDVLFDNVVKGTTNYYVTFYKSGETIDGTWRNPSVIANSGHFMSATSDNLNPAVLNGQGWQRVYFTIQFGDYAWSNINYVFQIYARDFTGDIYIKNVKVEIGDKVTTWTPNSADTLYSKMPISNTTVYDISGYQHNATANNITYSADTVINEICSVFTASTTSYIKVEDTTWMVNGSTEMTINYWAYSSDWTTYNTRMFSCTEGGGFNTEAGNSGYLRFPVHVYTNSGKTSTEYTSTLTNSAIKLADLTAGWHMFTFVYTTSGIKIYIDGVQIQNYSYASYGIHFQTGARLFLGCEANAANPTGPYFTGRISDFRLYYTELSSDEILDLYERRG